MVTNGAETGLVPVADAAAGPAAEAGEHPGQVPAQVPVPAVGADLQQEHGQGQGED